MQKFLAQQKQWIRPTPLPDVWDQETDPAEWWTPDLLEVGQLVQIRLSPECRGWNCLPEPRHDPREHGQVGHVITPDSEWARHTDVPFLRTHPIFVMYTTPFRAQQGNFIITGGCFAVTEVEPLEDNAV